MLNVLSQSVYYLPSLMAHTAAIAIAAMLWGRNRTAALWLGAGTAAQLLASIASFGTYAILWAEPSAEDVSTRATIQAAVGLMASLIRAGGELSVAGAVWIAVRGGTTPTGQDPYGFP